MKNIRKEIVTGNGGKQKECWIGLQPGDKVICKKTDRGLLDVGSSGMTLEFDSFVAGREYVVDHIYDWHGILVAYVPDEDNCLAWVTTELFDIEGL